MRISIFKDIKFYRNLCSIYWNADTFLRDSELML